MTPISTDFHQEPKKHEQMVANALPPQMVTNTLFGNPNQGRFQKSKQVGARFVSYNTREFL